MNRSANDLYGWQLNNPDQNVFDMQVVEVLGECSACEYADECEMPCESMRRLVPKEGTIIGLGHKEEKNRPMLSYFALVNQDRVQFIQLSSPDYLWATATYISYEHVPIWALSKLHLKRAGMETA